MKRWVGRSCGQPAAQERCRHQTDMLPIAKPTGPPAPERACSASFARHECFNTPLFLAKLQTPTVLVLRDLAWLHSRSVRSRLSADTALWFRYADLRYRRSMDVGVRRIWYLHVRVSLSELPPGVLLYLVVSQSVRTSLRALWASKVGRFCHRL